MSEGLRIAFFGTPEFAESVLRAMVGEGFNVVCAVTMPDKPVGRHASQLQASPVKRAAAELDIPLLQPEKLKDPLFLKELQSYAVDLQIVVAFRMLPEAVWNMPPRGTINLHASLLPQYRGAAPINWAIINGDTETGVTTFFLQHEIDTGDMIFHQRVPITPSDTAGTLHDKLMEEGCRLVVKTIRAVEERTAGTVTQNSVVQEQSLVLRHAPKLFNETCCVKWSRPAVEVRNFIRGLSPYPAAWSKLLLEDGRSVTVKIYGAELVEGGDSHCGSDEPGTVFSDGKRFMEVVTGSGTLKITDLQLSGKKRLAVGAFLCGFNPDGLHFEEKNVE